MMLRDSLDDSKQGPSKDLLKHIDDWCLKLKSLLDAQEPMTVEEQAGRLARSLNPRWREKATDYIGNGFNSLDSLITKLKTSYELRDSINNLSSSNNQSNRVEECDHHHHHDCSKSNYRRMRCTPRRCDGADHHQPEDYFKLPENAHKLREWEEEKKSSGKWRNTSSGGRGRGNGRSSTSKRTTAIRSYGNCTNYSHNPDEFLEALEHLTLEEREVTYNVEMDGKYSCSLSAQNAAHQMGKRLNIGMLDTGSSHYMMKDESLFVHGSLVGNKDPNAVLRLAGGDATLPIKAFGQFAHRNTKGELIIFNDVLFVPQLAHNLLAAGRLTRAGATTELLKDPHFRLVDRKKELFFGSFVGEGSLMFVGLNPVSHPTLSTQRAFQINKTKLNQLAVLKLHYSLGHPSKEYVVRMWRLGLTGRKLPEGVQLLDFDIISKCCICPLAKNHQLPFKGARTRATDFLQNVHLDLSGIFRTPSTAKDHYYVLFTDDYSGFKVEYGSRSKNSEDIFEIIKDYIAYSERHTENKLKKLSIDGGGEFLNDLLIPYCKSSGIVLRVTAPHTPQQNGVAERANRTIASKARAMLIQSGLGTSYWHRAVHHPVFLDNKTITSALRLKKTPHEVWYGNKPSINHIQTFGCLAYRLIRKEIRNGKLNPVSSPSVLIGIDEHNHNYTLLDLQLNKVHVSHDATFQPLIYPARKSDEDINPDWESIEEESIELVDKDVTDKEAETPQTHPKTHDEEEAIPDFNIPSGNNPEPRNPPDNPDSQGHRPEEEEWDQELVIEINPPAESLRRSGRDRRAPQRFSPGGNSVKMTLVEPGSYKKAMKGSTRKTGKRHVEKRSGISRRWESGTLLIDRRTPRLLVDDGTSKLNSIPMAQ